MEYETLKNRLEERGIRLTEEQFDFLMLVVVNEICAILEDKITSREKARNMAELKGMQFNINVTDEPEVA